MLPREPTKQGQAPANEFESAQPPTSSVPTPPIQELPQTFPSTPPFAKHRPPPLFAGYPPPPQVSSEGSTSQPQGFFANIPSSPLAQLALSEGLAYGSNILTQNKENVEKYVNKKALKYYFNVSTSYVNRKLRLILFPYTTKKWERKAVSGENGTVVYLPPRDDMFAPDLYIPLMAFITYVLLVGFVHGTAYRFTPEILGETISSGLGTIVLEVLLLKLGFYLLAESNFSVPLLDLVANSSYIFVGVVVNSVFGFLFGSLAFYVSWLFNSLSMGNFMIKTLKACQPAHTVANRRSLSSKRNYFLLIVAALQLCISFWLGSIS